MTQDVLLVPGAWSPTFCRAIRRAMDAGVAEPAAIESGAASGGGLDAHQPDIGGTGGVGNGAHMPGTADVISTGSAGTDAVHASADGRIDSVSLANLRPAQRHADADAAEVAEDVRRALDITIAPHAQDDVDEAMQAWHPHLDAFFGVPVAGSVGASCVRYLAGGRYRRHRDRDVEFAASTNDRRVTVIVWLNSAAAAVDDEGFTGGSLWLYPPAGEAMEIVPRTGTLVAFPSDWPHEVMPVIAGTRDVIVDWLY